MAPPISPEDNATDPIDPTHQYIKVRKEFNLPYDVLRHSYISYHVSHFRSIGDTALQAGNFERMIKKHYLNLVHNSDDLWKIKPQGGAGKVLQF